MGMFLLPALVPAATVALKENTLSPAVASPFVPSSKNGCAADPPIELRSPVSVMPVLTGLKPGITVTVRRDVSPALTEDGLAAPVPIGLEGPHTLVGEALLRGFAADAVKSTALLSVSEQPFETLTTEFVL